MMDAELGTMITESTILETMLLTELLRGNRYLGLGGANETQNLETADGLRRSSSEIVRKD